MPSSLASLLSRANPSPPSTSLVYAALARHQTALAWEMIRQGMPLDPNETHKGLSLLHVALGTSAPGPSLSLCTNLSAQVNVAACPDWSTLKGQVGNLERLACFLVLAGADPAAHDAHGQDALDRAFTRGFRSLWTLCRSRMPSVDVGVRLINGQKLALAATRSDCLDWLETLSGAGVDVENTDASGLPLSSHCPTADSFLRAAKMGWGPRNHDQAQQVLNHWMRLAKKNGTNWHASMQEALQSVSLADGALDHEKMAMAKQVEEWLHHPFDQYVPQVSAEERHQWTGLRHTVARGPHRGCWSAEAAEALAHLRTSTQTSRPGVILAPAVWDHQADLEIRPGLSARGLGALLTCLVDSPQDVAFYCRRHANKGALPQEGVDALKALVTRQSGWAWRTRATDVLVALDKKMVEPSGELSASMVKDYASVLPVLNFNANFLNRDWLVTLWNRVCPLGSSPTPERMEFCLAACLADLSVEAKHKNEVKPLVVALVQNWLGSEQSIPLWRLGPSARSDLKTHDAELFRLFTALHLHCTTSTASLPQGSRPRM